MYCTALLKYCTIAYIPLYLFNASVVDFYHVAYTLSYNLIDREKIWTHTVSGLWFGSTSHMNFVDPIETE
jgi:hypothetical protein